MPVRYFTLEEANALLPKLKPLMARLLKTRARVVGLSHQVEDTIGNTRSDFGGDVATRLAQDFVTIEALVDEIQAHGCVIKDINAGLLDFWAQKDGRDVYLCWRYGEEKVAYYHELHTGFKGRRPFE